MRLLQLYNQYRSMCGGEERVVQMTAALVEKNGGQARLLMRSSRGLDQRFSSKAKAFVTGIYNIGSYQDVRRAVREFRPDVVHAHNLYPMLSPSALAACRREGVPVVLSVHNYSMTCPHWVHFRNGNLCEKCVGGREYHCVLQNCRGNRIESLGYALRTATARKFGLFRKNATLVIALTRFARQRLIDSGFSADQVVVLPNMVDQVEAPSVTNKGQYVAFAGRFSAEKGIDTLLDAAREHAHIPVRLAGDGPLAHQDMSAPGQVTFAGRLERKGMDRFFRNARMVVVPSRWFEVCPLVISESMMHGLPVIASRIGGLGELVEEGKTGLLFEPGNHQDLAAKIALLWNNPRLCHAMGQAGRAKAMREYSAENYSRGLMEIYHSAMARANAVNRQTTIATPAAAAVAPTTGNNA
jgi:glycosyltransferase involved in cell wall biosynthesis